MGDVEERVVQGTQRPDGTYRKDRRIRAGYIAQDEQPVYQSQGILFRQGVPRCPGMDESQVHEAQKAQSQKTKAQKKNEKRKEKKQDVPENPASVTANLESLNLSKTKPSTSSNGVKGQSNVIEDQKPENNNPEELAEKRIRTLKKKVKQCEALLQRKEAGQALSIEEEEKLANMQSWLQEISQLSEVS